MITLLGCPKPFCGDIAVIQRNAVQSWTRLQPKPEIILLGDEKGVADFCDDMQVIHIAEVEKNEHGTPLVNSVFRIGQERASFPFVCYVNCDIMLMNDFSHAVKTVSEQMSKFLIIGQRWDVDIKHAWNFDSSNWEEDLLALLSRDGKLHSQTGIDYFIFPRGMYTDIPPFAIGRLAWDNWLVWRARTNGVPIVDATNAVQVVHQNHHYFAGTISRLDGNDILEVNHRIFTGKKLDLDGNMVELGPEAQRNLALVEGEKNLNIWAATWMINSQGEIKRRTIRPSLSYIYYQIRWVLPVYWPMFGRFLRWLLNIRNNLLSMINRKPRIRNH